jgi:hypothetical protein
LTGEFLKSAGISVDDGPFSMERTVEAVNSINNSLFHKRAGKGISNYLNMQSYPLLLPTKTALAPNLPVLGRLPNSNSYWRRRRRKRGFWIQSTGPLSISSLMQLKWTN